MGQDRRGADTQPALRVGLLGGFSLTVDGATLAADDLPAPTSRLVLGWLALHADRVQDRSAVAAALWPDRDLTDARQRLRHELWQLDRALTAAGAVNPVTASTHDVTLSTRDCVIDVVAFRRAARVPVGEPATPRQLGAAVSLYHGDLLPAVDRAWADRARRELRTTFLAMLHRLVKESMRRGDHAAALAWAQRRVAADPYDEEAHRQVIRLTALAGRSHRLPDAISSCRRSVREGLGRDVAPETADLIDRLSGATALPAMVPGRIAPTSPLVERDRERQELLGLVDRTFGGDGGLAFVVGDPGVGKSRLLDQIADDARWRGLTVLVASGTDIQHDRHPGPPPYSALRAAFERLPERVRRQVVALLGPQRAAAGLALPALRAHGSSLPSGAPPHVVRQAVQSAVVHTARVGPTLLIVDDVHRLGSETLEVTAAVSSQVSTLPLLLVIAHRPHATGDGTPVGRALRTMNRASVPRRLRLHGLSRDGSARLVRALSDEVEPARVLAAVDPEASGHPGTIVDAVRRLLRTDESQPATATLDTVIGRTLGQVPGVPLSAPTIARVCDVSVADVRVALTRLVERDVIRRGEDGRFEAVGPPTSPGESGRNVARRLLSELHGRDDVSLEAKADLAGRAGDVTAQVRYLTAAGRHALEVHAPSAARDRLERAVRLLVDAHLDRRERFELLAALERALWATGSTGEHVLRDLERAATDDRGRAYVRMRQAELCSRRGRYDEALKHARAARRYVTGSGDDGLAAAVDATIGDVLVRADRANEAVGSLRAAIRRHADPAHRLRVRVRLGDALRHLRRFAAADEELEAARRDAARSGDLQADADASALLGRLQLERGLLEPAEATLRHAIAVARQIDAGRAESWAWTHLGLLHMERRELADALSAMRRGGERAATAGDERGEAFADHRLGELHARWLGDLDRAEEYALGTLAHFERAGDERGVAAVNRTMAHVAMARGDLDAVWGPLREGLDRVTTGRGREALAEMMVRMTLTEAHLRSGDVHDARNHLDVVDRIRTQRQLRLYGPDVTSLHARLLTCEGRADDALALLGTELGDLDGSSGCFRLWLRAGDAAAVAGQDERAAQAYARAHRGLEEALRGLDDGLAARSRRSVPAHVEIRTAWRAWCRRTLEWSIAPARAPIGADEPKVTVEISVPPVPDPAARRQAELDLLDQARRAGGDPTVRDLADVLGVSPSTVGRDLTLLRQRGHEARTRGS